MAIDLKSLNKQMTQDTFPLPCISEAPHLGGKEYLRPSNVKNSQITDNHRSKFVFGTSGKRYESVRLPFGVSGLSTEPKRAIEKIEREVSIQKAFHIYL